MAKVDTRPLTPKQTRFKDEWLKHGNASEAFRTAYPRSIYWTSKALVVQASRTLALPSIQAAIHKAQAAIAKRNELSEDWVITELKRVYSLAVGDQPQPATFEGAVAKGSLELLGEHIGMWPKKEPPKTGDTYNLSIDARTQLASCSLEELMAMLAQMRSQKALPSKESSSQGRGDGKGNLEGGNRSAS